MNPFGIPTSNHLPRSQRIEGAVLQRYEDLAQDGRLCLLGMPHALGRVIWAHLIEHHNATRELKSQGVVAILTRLVLAGTEAQTTVTEMLKARAAYDIAHSRTADHSVDKLHLNLWLDMERETGELLGQVFAEHVFTKLFAPAGQRKVRKFESEHMPAVPEALYEMSPPDNAAQLPPGAQWLEPSFSRECNPVFGLDHTDANQHVNSLVYPQLFIDAALRRVCALGKNPARLARTLEIAFRKPSFAGERLELSLRAFEHNGALGAAGRFHFPDEQDPARAHCFARVVFDQEK